MSNVNISLFSSEGVIINCKGFWHHGVVPCKFMILGKWGDKRLTEHEKLEESKSKFENRWLGFEEELMS